MRIGIVCYPSVGGSGIVATELAKQLARRGHEIHIISSDLPFRLSFEDNVYFHQVETPAYPLFKEPPYLLTLANKLVEVHRLVGLDVIHAHYAVPHATAAYLAREMLGPGGPKVVTTLHGTDITLMGADPSFTEIIAFSINQSDAVTAVSRSLRADTFRNLPTINREIDVIYNFLECDEWRRTEQPGMCSRLARCGEPVIVHMSNFRKVKRVQDVVQTFARINQAMPARLMFIGDGPEVKACCDVVNSLGLRERVLFMGNQENVVPLLSVADLFLLPSEQESFGLAALEAMACGAPVVAADVGGLPEVVVEGETGYLCPVGDVEAMAARSIRLLKDGDLHREFSAAAVRHVRTQFCAARVVPQYEELYERVLGVREKYHVYPNVGD